MSLTHLGRSTALLIGTRCPSTGALALTVTAATLLFVRHRSKPRIAAVQDAGNMHVVEDGETTGVKDQGVEAHSPQDRS